MYIITKQTGQLGNKLIMFSHFIASAIENNQKIINCSFFMYADLFKSTNKDIFCRYPPEKQSFFKNLFIRKLLFRLINLAVKERVVKWLKYFDIKIITATNYKMEVFIQGV